MDLNSIIPDPALTGVAIAYNNPEFLSEALLPVKTVGRMYGRYFKYDKSIFRRAAAKRAIGSPANEVGYNLTSAVFYTEDHALKTLVEDEIRDQALQPIDPMIDAANFVQQLIMLDKEMALASWMQSTTNIPQNVTLSGTSQWSDFTNSDPISDVQNAMDTIRGSIYRKPNTLVIGRQVMSKLRNHPKIISRFQYSMPGVITAALLQEVFDVENVIIADAGYNTANEGQADNLTYVWGKNAWLIYVNPRPAVKDITFGYTFAYGQKEVKRWRDEDRGGTYIRNNYNYDQEIVAPQAAYLIKNAVA